MQMGTEYVAPEAEPKSLSEKRASGKNIVLICWSLGPCSLGLLVSLILVTGNNPVKPVTAVTLITCVCQSPGPLFPQSSVPCLFRWCSWLLSSRILVSWFVVFGFGGLAACWFVGSCRLFVGGVEKSCDGFLFPVLCVSPVVFLTTCRPAR